MTEYVKVFIISIRIKCKITVCFKKELYLGNTQTVNFVQNKCYLRNNMQYLKADCAYY